MDAAALNEPGRRKLAELSQRTVVLGAIVSLHVLIVYLLPFGDQDYGRFHAPITEAEIIPADPRKPRPPPPPLPPVMLQTSPPIDIPAVQVTIDMPAEPLPAIRSIDTRELLKRAMPVSTGMPPPQIDPFPVIRPQPIAGPRGVDRYPNASIAAKESGMVVMKICVTTQGSVDRVELAHSSGFPRLDQAAMSMAAEYRFRPAMREGHPVPACAQYNIIFKVT
jgi:periplasmic protein TonB